MHVPRRRRQTTQSTAYTATRHWQPGRRRHTYVYGAAAMARSPSLACPIHQFAPGGGGGASLERRACIALHASCMALSPRARELPAARTAAARPASGRAARAAGPGLVRCICMAWTPGRRGAAPALLAAAGGRPRAEQRAFVWIGGFSFLVRGIQRTLFVRMNELA